jgi:hypothetical protein
MFVFFGSFLNFENKNVYFDVLAGQRLFYLVFSLFSFSQNFATEVHVEINVSITVLLLHATQSRKIFLYELFD